MFLVDWIKKFFRFFLIDSTVNIIGNLLEQPPVMWIFIGWGWLSILVMVTSVINTLIVSF